MAHTNRIQTVKNKYDYLKIDCLDDVEPVDATSSWAITVDSRESITITTALMLGGFWVYGYIVGWARGRSSSRRPCAELGLFHSQRDAKLHAVGFLMVYIDFFLKETQEAIIAAERTLMQKTLFE